VRYTPSSKRTFRGDIATVASMCASIAPQHGIAPTPSMHKRGFSAARGMLRELRELRAAGEWEAVRFFSGASVSLMLVLDDVETMRRRAEKRIARVKR
jgi:hypothetical protein